MLGEYFRKSCVHHCRSEEMPAIPKKKFQTTPLKNFKKKILRKFPEILKEMMKSF